MQLLQPSGKPALIRAAFFKTLPLRVGMNGRRSFTGSIIDVSSGREEIVNGSTVAYNKSVSN